jgi:hypothetical protein
LEVETTYNLNLKMKYIITESRLDNVIFNYLDIKLNGIEKRKGVNGDIIFAFPNEEYGILGWKKSGALYVFYELMDGIENMFGLENSDALDVIGRYIEDRYNLKVGYTFKLIYTI